MNDVKSKMTPEMREKLAKVAKVYTDAPVNLQAVIFEAAAEGANGNEITEAIGFAYGPDYVRQLIREARADGKLPVVPPRADDAES